MTPRRYELSDFEWSIIEPLLANKRRGVARSDVRKVLNCIYWRLRTGSPWLGTSLEPAAWGARETD
jgi:transposase